MVAEVGVERFTSQAIERAARHHPQTLLENEGGEKHGGAVLSHRLSQEGLV